MGLLGRKAPDEPFELRAKTLDWVNRQRKAYKRALFTDLPQGIPGSAIKCPVSRAFEDIFGVGMVLTSPAYLRRAPDQEIITKLPEYVTAFVGKFDNHGYVDLEEDPRPPNPHFLYTPEEWIESYYTLGRCA